MRPRQAIAIGVMGTLSFGVSAAAGFGVDKALGDLQFVTADQQSNAIQLCQLCGSSDIPLLPMPPEGPDQNQDSNKIVTAAYRRPIITDDQPDFGCPGLHTLDLRQEALNNRNNNIGALVFAGVEVGCIGVAVELQKRKRRSNTFHIALMGVRAELEDAQAKLNLFTVTGTEGNSSLMADPQTSANR